MRVKVKYSASSNIGYHGTWTFNVDDLDWAELDEDGRNKLVEEMVAEQIANDISWNVTE